MKYLGWVTRLEERQEKMRLEHQQELQKSTELSNELRKERDMLRKFTRDMFHKVRLALISF